VLKAMIETYKSADGDGEKVFMLNMLPEIIEELAKTVDKVTVDRVSVIDAGGNGNGHGSGLGRFVNQFPAAVISLSEQIENATGVNILSSLNADKKAPAAGGKTDTVTG
jgi:flotillin